ncbi:MAG: chemotaxis protein CheW [Limnochordia bacterium]
MDKTWEHRTEGMEGFSTQEQYMTFLVAEEEFGVGVLQVQELIRYEKPSRVPNAPDVMAGVLNFRGNIIPIIDVRRKFNFPPVEYDDYSVIIVLEVGGRIMGLIVDRVLDILSIGPQDIQENLDFPTQFNADYLLGLGKVGQRLIFLLNPQRLLSQVELGQVAAVEGEQIDAGCAAEG